MQKLLTLIIVLFFSNLLYAKQTPLTSQPTACITSSFSNTGSPYWETISLQLTNQCGQPVNFQNATITFLDQSNLNETFWGNFSPLSYPVNTLQITSQPQAVGNYLSSLSLAFPTDQSANSLLPDGSSITIIYGAPTADYIPGSVNVYLNAVIDTGSINIHLQALPNVLSGYTGNPAVTLTRSDTGASTVTTVNWNSTANVSNLANGITYNFSTPIIVFNGNTCVGTFSPASAAAASNAPTTQLTYTCTPVALNNITLNVTGAPVTVSTVTVTLTPDHGSSPINQTINVANGQGSANIKLVNGGIYTVSSTSINGYAASYNPQPLTSTANAIESITYTQNTSNAEAKIIGYLPGWLTPPTAQQIISAGYTHIIVAFGVFSTTSPGQITPAFSTINASYIQSLQKAGIKVLLSLGGASTSLPNTTVSFDQALQMAASPIAFQTTFIQSLQNLIKQYGFNGFDFDIESGLNGGGTFTNPQGDIAVLANIINTLHANNPLLLLSLAPQTANISATQSFNETWGNYASLIMQTANSLSWVGIQLYNTGCMFGIDSVCYDPNLTNSPNFSVAMATDLLANWPAQTSSGQPTGFQPYISMLKPSQVVLGYVAPNASGSGDGAPIIPVSTIKRAIQCLRTGIAGSNSCDTFVPPAAYPKIGGVFDWQVNNDQNNNFGFAVGLQNCVLNGNCN